MFIKIQKRKEENFLRVSVDGKPLELTQGHGDNVLPERWNLRLKRRDKRKPQCRALVRKRKTTECAC